MTPWDGYLSDLAVTSGTRLSLPEYRQIELYTQPSRLRFGSVESGLGVELAGLCRAFLLLDTHFERAASGERVSPWRRYLDLPRDSASAGIVAELYRILRLVSAVLSDPRGRVEWRDGTIAFASVTGAEVMALDMTPAGVVLVESAVAYYLASFGSPYPDAYVKAMMLQYYTDIIAEIRRFTDENKALYQFRSPFYFNRHFRFECDNPKFSVQDGGIKIDIGSFYANAAIHPIDFYLVVGETLYIVPVEACPGGHLANPAPWRSRCADGITLPAAFRHRLGHQSVAVNQPMT